MKFIFTTIALCIGLTLQAQDSLNMSLLYKYDSDTIPTAGSRHYNECFGYVDCDGNEIAILGSSGRVHFFDVTDPVNSYEIAWFTGGDVTVWRDMKTYQDHVYSVCDACSEGLMIFDMADAPNSVTLTNQTNEFFGKSHNIFVDEPHGRLYAVGTDSVGNGLVVLDIATNPDTPILLKNMPLPGGYVHDMYIKDHIAFCNHGGNGMYAYDFTDLDNPILLGTLTDYAESGYNHSCWVNEDFNTLVLCDETHNRGVKTINIEDISDMYVEQAFRSTLLAPADTASIAHNPLIRGNIAFISYYHDGVQVYDISDPANVEKVAYFDTEPNNSSYGGFQGSWGVYPFFPSGNILASDLQNGLFVLSLENVDLVPVEPTTLPDTEITFSGTTDLCIGDSLLLRAKAGFDTYEWSKDGIVISTADSLLVSQAGFYSVCISNGYCDACSDNLQVTVNDYPNVELEVNGPIEFCPGQSTVLSVATGANYYIWQNGGIGIVGEENANITITESGNYSVVAGDDFCFTTSEEQVITVFETTDFSIAKDDNILTAPNASNYQWYFENEPISNATSQAYEADENGNYYVIITDINGCEVVSETLNVVINSVVNIDILHKFQAFPNPVNDILTIEMNSSELSNFTISLQTIDGKTLTVLEKQILESGIFEINMTDFAAGVYLLKVENESGVLVKKINKQ